MEYNTSSKAEYLNLEAILRDRYFIIPDYQRGYSWDKQQVNDLIDDIEKIIMNSAKDAVAYSHFTGTIVITENDKNSGWDVVDGQQRLTSLILLISCIYHFKTPENKSVFQDFYDDYVMSGNAGNKTCKLTPNNQAKDFFTKIIKNEVNANEQLKKLSHKRLFEADSLFKEWLKDKSTDEIKKIISVITEQMYFIVFSTETKRDIGLMFEVINNRGKPLSELEKIKNYLIYYASSNYLNELHETINTNWSEILDYLNQADVRTNDEENDFLRYCYLVFFNHNRSDSSNIYNNLKTKHITIKEDDKEREIIIKKIEEFISFLNLSAKHYAFFYNESFFNSNYTGSKKDDLGHLLTYLRHHHAVASIIPLYLSIMTKDEVADKLTHLALLEKLNFRVYCLPKIMGRTDAGQGELYKMAYEYYSKRKISIEEGLKDVSLNDAMVSFIKEHAELHKIENSLKLIEYDYYGWDGLKYFLIRYEEYIRDGDKSLELNINDVMKSNKVSKEHIWASNNRKSVFSKKDENKIRLGNFVLLEITKNIKGSDKDIPEKIEEMKKMKSTNKKSRFLQIDELIGIYDAAVESLTKKRKNKINNYYKELAGNMSKKREEEFIKFLKDEWTLKGESLEEKPSHQ